MYKGVVLTESWLNLPAVERLDLGLMEMVRRFAIQAAAAKAKRIMHGTITSSNLCVDGRWIDYGTVAALPHYANTKSYGLPATVPTFWQEQSAFTHVIKNLCFYIGKYFHGEQQAQKPARARALQQCFDQHYALWLRRSFVALTGFPSHLLEIHWHTAEYQRLAGVLLALARFGVEKAFAPSNIDLEAFGPNPFSEVLPLLAEKYDSPEIHHILDKHIPSKALALELVEAYTAIARMVALNASANGVQKEALRTLCTINAAKNVRNIPVLYRQNIVDHGSLLIERHRDAGDLSVAVQSWIDGLIDEADIIYRPPGALQSLVWKSGNQALHFDALKNEWIARDGISSQSFPASSFDATPHCKAVRQYWKGQLSRVFDQRSALKVAA